MFQHYMSESTDITYTRLTTEIWAALTYQNSVLHLVTFDLQLDFTPQGKFHLSAHRLPHTLYSTR